MKVRVSSIWGDFELETNTADAILKGIYMFMDAKERRLYDIILKQKENKMVPPKNMNEVIKDVLGIKDVDLREHLDEFWEIESKFSEPIMIFINTGDGEILFFLYLILEISRAEIEANQVFMVFSVSQIFYGLDYLERFFKVVKDGGMDYSYN